MIEKEYSYSSLDWQSVAVGIFIGFALTLAMQWYMTKDDNPYDWCSYLSKDKSSYCMKLYEQSTKEMQKYSEYQEAQYDGSFPNDGFR